MDDSVGETVAIWQRQAETGNGYVVQASVRAPGATFAAPFELSAAAAEPQVAMAPTGEAVAAWRHFDVNREGSYVIQASFRPRGASFSTPEDVAVVPNHTPPAELHLAVNAAGCAALVWKQEEAEGGTEPPVVIEASVRTPGGAFSAPQTISAVSPPPGSETGSPRVAIDASGHVTAVWEYLAGASTVIEASSGSATGTFSSPVALTAGGADASSPAVAVDSSGDAIAAWTRLEGGDYIAEGATAPSGGSFSNPVGISAPGGDAGSPDVAMAPDGRAVAVWTRTIGAGYVVEASRWRPGGEFSPPAELSAPNQNAFDPRVALGSDGASTVVWRRSNGSNDIAQATRALPEGSFSSPADLSSPGRNAVLPNVAMDGSGDATVVWWRSDGSNEIVQAAGYDGDAPVLRNLSIPATGTVGVPVGFSVDPFDVWPIASTGFAFGDGASAAGTSVSHTYSAAGSYTVTVTANDAAGTLSTSSGTIAIAPRSHTLRLGRILRNKRKGTVTVPVTVSGPGTIALTGKGVRRVVKRAAGMETVKLPIVAGGRTLKVLSRRGRVRVHMTITFRPDGATSVLGHLNVRLIG